MNRYVIVGGVAGGMSAATRLRRLDSNSEIVVLEKSGYVSYANCGLPYFVGGVIEEEDALLLQTPKSLFARFRLDVRVHNQVTQIDRVSKKLEIKDKNSNHTYSLGYDKLILSTGAAPIVPSIPGVERARTLRNIEDVELIVNEVSKKPSSAVIIGGGFIGLEIAENLVHRGIATALVEASDQVLGPLDPEMASLVALELRRNGVDLHLGLSAKQITAESVVLENGRELSAELVILAIGVRPDTLLAHEAGLEIGEKGGVVVDQFNLTNDPNIYAIGDMAEKIDELDGSATLVPLANIANRHGRVVADHIAGLEVRPVKTIGTAIVKVFDLTIATTGWNQKRLTAKGIKHMVVHTHPNSHATYYPGARQMTIKLIFSNETGEIYGAQAVGYEGVDKRIDVIATAMRGQLRAPELADLELAYAPPFGSAKDPVNMLGYIAENLLSGLVNSAQWSDVKSLQDAGYQVLDVRTKAEFEAGSIPGAINIPVDELRERAVEIPKMKLLVTCQVGQRGHTASMLLKSMGFEALNLDGGYLLWSKSPEGKLSTQRAPKQAESEQLIGKENAHV